MFQSQEGIFCDMDNLVCGGAGTCLPKSIDGVIVNDLDGNPLTFRYRGCQCPELAIEGKCQVPHWVLGSPYHCLVFESSLTPLTPPLLLPVGMTYTGEYCMDVQVDLTGGGGGGGGDGWILLLIAIIAGTAAALGIAYTIFTK